MKTKIAWLFWLQILMAWVYTVPQVMSLISGKTGGLTLAMYVLFMAFLTLSLFLALASYRIGPSPVRRQTVIVYAQWIVLVGVIILVGAGKIVWRPSDTVVCSAILVFSVATVLLYRGFQDPMGRAWIALWCKALPQVWLAYTMFVAGRADGLPLITLVAGYLTACPRLVQIIIGGRTKGWDRPTRGLLMSETANVGTWVIVTIVWIIV